jgi:hypothetical protein
MCGGRQCALLVVDFGNGFADPQLFDGRKYTDTIAAKLVFF